ncbi:putative phage baseplate assembly protein [Streptomyces griseochromogenes]|uniref:Phage baseplate assembly protein n=1 Tax=Streptomyces griseochromogenes TaxID=68214 RepID=A0A1B1B379_9ACTN|nr:putative baseplate assembly protein [Streptomyces griseochromogenes]ANP53276.1 putative baseplate assembly protein [Streptomyces griseochromogenes]MBP2055528.1 putative phage baseplate assembly protein [Streptomyces griseochromogenes]
MSRACTCGGACGGHDERLAPAPIHNPPPAFGRGYPHLASLGRTALDHRVGEYGSFLAALLDRLASPAYPALARLAVRTPDDPAIGLLDATAVLGDLLTFHSERIADEAYLRTADEHRSLVLLGRLVGHRPRPGVAAGTHLAYTLERDPRAETLPVPIPRGARSHSVPASADEPSLTFETARDLTARWDWNELKVRRRRPSLLTPEDLDRRSELFVEGTANSLRTGDQLLFVFGEQAGGERRLLPVAGVRIDREEEVTALTLPKSAPPTLKELVDEVRRWTAAPAAPGEPGDEPPTPEVPDPRPVSRLIEDFDDQVLAPLRADLDGIKTPGSLAARLGEPVARLREAEVLAEPYEDVAAWFERLEAVLAELAERARELAPAPPVDIGPARKAAVLPDARQAALQALSTVLPALRSAAPAPRPGTRAQRPGTDTARLLSALDPGLGSLYPAWRTAAAPGTPQLLRELLAMRVTAAPFGATAPLKPVQDERGRVIRTADWPLTGAVLASMRVVHDPAGKVPVRAEFQYVEGSSSDQRAENLPVAQPVTFVLGPGRVDLSTRAAHDRELSWLTRRPATAEEPGVTARLHSGLPERSLFVSRPEDDGTVHVAVHNGTAREVSLRPGETKQFTHGEYQVSVRYAVGSTEPDVEIVIAGKPAPLNRRVLQLDSVHDGVTVGSWVAIQRPAKGAAVPGDAKLALVTTQVVAARTAAYSNYGITGRGTELTLADPWLDEFDVLLSHIRDTTVHAAGEPLRPADEPLGEDVHGNEIELAELYDGLRPGRTLIVSGERTDVPGTVGVTTTEVVTIAAADPAVDPQLPGDHVHTRLTLTTDLVHRYHRASVRILGNVVEATHGESREEAIGSGDSDRVNQTFALWQSPLTWLAADNPLGATPVLEIRVDGVLWHEVDSLAGRGATERVYITGTASDGRTTVTFGDGMHGARLPSGHENVRARYRFGTGKAANIPADRITQPLTRPLGVTAVTNPRPATGGADADGPGLTRRTIPLAVSALDRLVSEADYEDFARSRAGIGRAAARELFDGRRRVLHVTVAGTDDVPLAEDNLRPLRAALTEYGDPNLPVRVDARELVLLLISAKVKLAPDHAWEIVEPRLRQALLLRLGYEGREPAEPARLSEVLATAHTVPGVDHVDVDVFTGVPASATPEQLTALLASPGTPRASVPAHPAAYEERTHTVRDPNGETLTSVCARYGLPLAELLRLNPDITDTRRLDHGRTVFVFRGIRPAQLTMLSARAADTLILTEVK